MRAPRGTQKTGLPGLDAELRRLGAFAFPAFPFDLGAGNDAVGLDHWIAVATPGAGSIEPLRRAPGVLPESYLPAPEVGRGIDPTARGVILLQEPRRKLRARALGEIRSVAYRAPEELGTGGRAARAIGAPSVWAAAQGVGVGIAVVDTGLQVAHPALAAKLREKVSDGSGLDGDGNGIPGDVQGVNFSSLAIAATAEGPVLALREGADPYDEPGGAGQGSAVAALAAGERARPLGAGTAPGAWLLPIKARGSEATSHWPLAAGVVYAVAEGARVITCAWPSLEPSWLLHDALRFAEDNCAIPVCASESPGAPAEWRVAWLRERGAGSGALRDAQSGERRADFFERPLRALLLAALDPAEGLAPDLVLPRALRDQGIVSARADEASEGAHGWFDRPAAAAAVVAGTAALVLERRPDLPPWAVREALVTGAEERAGRRELSAPGALRAADALEKGECGTRRIVEPPPSDQPFWKRIKTRVSLDPRGRDDPLDPDGTETNSRRGPPPDR